MGDSHLSKYLISTDYFIIFITKVLALDLISSSQHAKCSNSSVMRITIINRGKDTVKVGRLMHSLVLCSCDTFKRQERLIYYSLLDLRGFTFLLKMENLSTQINADLAIFFQGLVDANITDL